MSVKTVITDGGLELLRAAPNHKLVYTRAVCGSGSVAGTQLAELTDVVDYVMDLSIVDVKPTETAATLRLQLDNSRAPREFQLYQIGVFARLLGGDTEIMGERLLQVMQYDAPDIVRAVPHVSEYVVNTLMGQAETVEGIIDLAAYVSIRQHMEIVGELQAKIADQQIQLDTQNEKFNNRNILHNWDFRNPINQLLQLVYSAFGYAIDRWYMNGTGLSLQIINPGNNGYITLTNTSVEDLQLRQKLEPSVVNALRGKTLTASVLLGDGTIVSASGVFTTTAWDVSIALPQSNFIAIGSYEGVTYFSVVLRPGTSVSLKALKLEVGSVSTLANDAPADYAVELAKCQRYYECIPAGFRIYKLSSRALTSLASENFHLFYKVRKRSNPIVSVEYETSSAPGVWNSATLSHPSNDFATDYNNITWNSEYISFRNIIIDANL